MGCRTSQWYRERSDRARPAHLRSWSRVNAAFHEEDSRSRVMRKTGVDINRKCWIQYVKTSPKKWKIWIRVWNWIFSIRSSSNFKEPWLVSKNLAHTSASNRLRGPTLNAKRTFKYTSLCCHSLETNLKGKFFHNSLI